MDWKKAKNYTIIFLLILNVMLLVLNIIKYNKYSLSQNQKKSITAILKNNNIIIDTDVPNVYKPMPQMTLKSSSYDVLELQRIFFNNTADVKRTEEFEKTIFSFNNESLTIYENTGFYENKNKIDGFKLNEKNATKAVAKYVSKFENKFADLKLNQVNEKEEYIILKYDYDFKDYLIFNNSITFKVFADGSFSCDFSYFEPIQLVGEKTQICSADEALFAFYKGVKNVLPKDEDSETRIVKIDLGYFTEEYLETEAEVTAVPFYRIFTKDIDEPYYINAYNGSMIYQ